VAIPTRRRIGANRFGWRNPTESPISAGAAPYRCVVRENAAELLGRTKGAVEQINAEGRVGILG
jgi:hypothetical protein